MVVAWPPGWKRATYRRRAAFGPKTIARASAEIHYELKRIAAANVRIDSDLRTRKDGAFISDQRLPDDPGVVVYFTLPNGRKVAMPCDKWDRPEHNLWAVAKTLEAKRAVERWGCASMDAEYEGYAALPSGDKAADDAAAASLGFAIIKELPPNEILGVLPNADADTINGAWRAKAARLHPDRPGGDAAQFQRATKARDAMLAALGVTP